MWSGNEQGTWLVGRMAAGAVRFEWRSRLGRRSVDKPPIRCNEGYKKLGFEQRGNYSWGRPLLNSGRLSAKERERKRELIRWEYFLAAQINVTLYLEEM